MSDNQNIWSILWKHARDQPSPASPFEIDDVIPTVAKTLKLSGDRARKSVGLLLGELGRLPQGRQYFAREGNAVVPLPEFLQAKDTVAHPVDNYPYEL